MSEPRFEKRFDSRKAALLLGFAVLICLIARFASSFVKILKPAWRGLFGGKACLTESRKKQVNRPNQASTKGARAFRVGFSPIIRRPITAGAKNIREVNE